MLNRPGAWTWPIVQMTYIYVRQNLTSIMNPNEKTLLKAFLTAVYDPNFNKVCVDDFGFTLPQDSVKQKALNAIDTLIADDGGVDWIFEQDTAAIVGAGDYVISAKRKTIADVQLQDLREDSSEVKTEVLALRALVDEQRGVIANLESRLAAAETKVDTVTGTVNTANQERDNGAAGLVGDFSETDEQQLRAALVLSSLSFVLWMVWILFSASKWISGK